MNRMPLTVGLLTMLLLSGVFSLTMGAYDLEGSDLMRMFRGQAGQTVDYLVWQIRLPRIVLAAFVGAGLAVSGAAIQGLFRNPLADPGFIGITSGAMLFAVIAILLSSSILAFLAVHLQQGLIVLFAFAGALLTTWLVYLIASRSGQVEVVTMLLCGIAITALAGALAGYIIYRSDEHQLRDITYWTLGSFSAANWSQVWITAPVVILGCWMLNRDAKALNAFLLGEAEARYIGFDIEKIKKRVIFICALMVGACISVTGLIGFVGLVIPHFLRLLSGTDHRRLLRNSALLGAGFLILTDALARTIVAPAELPIGILTALVGAPFFIWLLLRRQRNVRLA